MNRNPAGGVELPLFIPVFFFFWFVLEWLSLLRTLFYDMGLRIREWQREERQMREGIGYVQRMSKLLKNLNPNQSNQFKPKLYSIPKFENEKEKNKSKNFTSYGHTRPVSLMVADISFCMCLPFQLYVWRETDGYCVFFFFFFSLYRKFFFWSITNPVF